MPRPAARQTLAKLARLLWNHSRTGRIRIVGALLLLFAAKGLELYVPIIYARIVDSVNVEQPHQVAIPLFLIVAYGLIRLCARLFGELRDTLFVTVSQPTIRMCLLESFNRLHALSHRFHLERRTGEVARYLERGSRGIEFLLRFMLFSIMPSLLEIVFVSVLLSQLFGFGYSAVALLSLILFIVWSLWATEWRLKFRRQMNAADNKAYSKAVDSLLNYETVKIFAREEYEQQRFNDNLYEYQRASIRSTLSLMLLNMVQTLIIVVGGGVIVWMAAHDRLAGTISMGDFVLIGSYLMMLFQPLNMMGFVYREIRRSITDMEDLFSILSFKPDIRDATHPVALPQRSSYGLSFENVCFGYRENQAMIRNLNLTIEGGENVAVVGTSGSGKSTLARLILRFYDVHEGSITVGGVDVRKLKQSELRRCVGIVPQDTVLFNDTLYHNIAYGNVAASEEQVWQAARASNLEKLIQSQPEGMNTLVGERGLKLSGGEKQRVSIARVLLKNPHILLLDEATSSLDSDNEQMVLEALHRLMQHRTTLTIAHRLSTIVDADRILVMDKGCITEQGKHAQLLKQGGLYAKLWELQAQHQSG